MECYSNNSTETTVTIGGLTITPYYVQNDFLRFKIPDGITGEFPLIVNTLGLASSPSTPLTIDSFPTPKILNMGIIGGSNSINDVKAGDFFVIQGKSFCVNQCGISGNTETTVDFAGIIITPYYVSSRTITFRVPANATSGFARINIETSLAKKTSLTSQQKFIITPPSINISGIIKSGDGTIFTTGDFAIISGSGYCKNYCGYFKSNFSDGINPEVDIKINSTVVEPAFVSLDGTSIIVEITSTMSSGLVEVITPWGSAISSEITTIQ